jgi:hypothetical protein
LAAVGIAVAVAKVKAETEAEVGIAVLTLHAVGGHTHDASVHLLHSGGEGAGDNRGRFRDRDSLRIRLGVRQGKTGYQYHRQGYGYSRESKRILFHMLQNLLDYVVFSDYGDIITREYDLIVNET